MECALSAQGREQYTVRLLMGRKNRPHMVQGFSGWFREAVMHSRPQNLFAAFFGIGLSQCSHRRAFFIA
jgi:hypothetical protein